MDNVWTTPQAATATAIGLGILLDATLIRSVLVPALVVLLGRWNWWFPEWLSRALLVAPGPFTDDPVPPAVSPERATCSRR